MIDTNWEAPTRRIATVILLMLFAYIVYLCRPVLPYFITGALIAFLLAPIVSFLHEKIGLSKWISVLIVYLFLSIVLIIVLLVLIPALWRAIRDINIDFVPILDNMLDSLKTSIETYRTIEIVGITYDLSSTLDPVLEGLNTFNLSNIMPPIDSIVASIPYTVQTTWGFASSVLGTVVSAILTSLMTIFFAVYFSLDGNSFRDRFLELVPESYRSEIKELLSRIRRMWGSYFRGQFTLGIIIGTAIWFMGSIIGLPGAFAIGVFTGMMEVLPSLGPIIASFPAMTVALVQGSNVFEMSNFNFMILVLVLYTIIQQIEANFLIPKILGNAVELHPIVVMTAVVVGMTTGGVLGALVATPITASCKILVLYIYAKILKQEPFLDSDEPLDRLPDLKKRVKSTQRKLSRVWQHLMKQRKLE